MAQVNKRENYFEMNLKDHDENFINNKSVQDIQRDAKKRIFKDMIYGNIDYEVFGNYFRIPNFLDALINVAKVECDKHNITAAALQKFHMDTANAPAYNLYIQHANCAYVLNCILFDLEKVKMNNYDIKFLLDLQIQISTVPNAKRDYSEFY